MHNLIKNELREGVDFLVETCHNATREDHKLENRAEAGGKAY